VVEHMYRHDSMPDGMIAPYRVRLEKGGEFVWASVDDDRFIRRRRVDVSERLLRVAAHFNLSFRDVYAVAFGWTPLSEEATARKAMVEADVDGDGAGSSAGSLDAQATAASSGRNPPPPPNATAASGRKPPPPSTPPPPHAQAAAVQAALAASVEGLEAAVAAGLDLEGVLGAIEREAA